MTVVLDDTFARAGCVVRRDKWDPGQGGAERDRLTAPPADDERAQAGLDSERLRQIAEWLSMEHGHEETAKRVNLIADRHDRLAAGLRRQGPPTDAQVASIARALYVAQMAGADAEPDWENETGYVHDAFMTDARAALEAARGQENTVTTEEARMTEFERGVRAGVENMTMFFQDENEHSIHADISDDLLARHADGAIQQAMWDEEHLEAARDTP